MTAKNPQILQIILVALISSILCPLTSGRIIHVDNTGQADFQTIQAAIDDANNGDTILVAPGTYTGDGNRDIEFKGKAITVKSEEGPESCIIDCQGTDDEVHRGFYLHNGEDANSVIQDLTMTNGYVWRPDLDLPGGGGICCNESSPLIKNCIITGNFAYFGGGIAAVNSNVQIIGCIVKKNTSEYGGGISIGYKNVSESALVKNCIITGNHATYHPIRGGGILIDSDANITGCTITGNHGSGGGIGFRNGANVTNSIIWNNTSGVYKYNENEVAVLYYNTDPRYPPISSPISIENSLVGKGGEDDYIFYKKGYEDALIGEWISGDPYFVDAGYWDSNGTPDYANDAIWVEGDYHLKSQSGRWDPNSQSWVIDEVTSPCIDTGDPNSSIGDEPFPNGGRINMGAYGGSSQASKSPSGLHSKYGGGTGESNSPYLIYTAQHLNALGAEPNDWDKYFKLMADIDLSGYLYDCEPIAPDTNNIEAGFQGTFFTGTFDGNGYTISQLSITGVSYLGLFGQMESGAEIRNLGVVDVNITGSGDYFGALAGFSRGNITASYCTGEVSGDRFVGGLTGRNWGEITASYNACAVAGNEDAGGIAAGNYGNITNCYNIGAITANQDVGGLVGENYGSITTSYSTGLVNGSQRAGGIVGYNWSDAEVSSSFWDMETSGLSASAGGTGKTTAEMQTANTFLEAGWDFVDETENGAEDIWWILEGLDYPRLSWEAEERWNLV